MKRYKVKVIVEETYIVDMPDDHPDAKNASEFLAGDPNYSVIKNRKRIEEVSSLIKDPTDHSKEERRLIDGPCELITMEKFADYVKSGFIIDYDGFGFYSDGKYEYDRIYTVEQLDNSYTHVYWCNN